MVRKRVLMGTTTAPMVARAKKVTSHSGRWHPEGHMVALEHPQADEGPGGTVNLRLEVGKTQRWPS